MELTSVNNPEFDAVTFSREMKQPFTVDGDKNQGSYKFYVINRQYTDKRPMVAYLGLGSTPNTLTGRLPLEAYAKVIDRTVIAPMNTHAPSATNQQAFANGHAHALEKIVDQPIDIVGVSWGGTLGYLVAETIGDQANHLITVSSAGTLNGLGRYALAARHFLSTESRQLKGTIEATRDEIDFHDILDTPPSLRNIEKIRLIRLLGRQSFRRIPYRLHPQTTWHDIVSDNDIFTASEDHVSAVTNRNQLYPNSSRLSKVENHGHLWSHMRIPLAQLVRISLELDRDFDQLPATEVLRVRDDFSGVDAV